MESRMQRKKSVTIMSWNVQWGRGADCRVDWHRIIAEIRRIAPDIVVLQEVAQHYPELPDNDDADQVAILAADLPEYLACYAPGIDTARSDGRRKRFGNWLGSRHTIRAWRSVALPAPPATTAKWLPRTAVVAEVAIAGRMLTVVGTHLEYYCARQRMAQVEALKRMVVESVPSGEAQTGDAQAGGSRKGIVPPAVLVGDLNFSPQSPEYRALAAGNRWVDAWSVAHPGKPHAHTVGLHGAPWPDHPYCCDYAWVTPDLVAQVVAVEVCTETTASDHQPVVLTLSWPE
jgi:endonuclease/exonuclease/phosphatase family metal-dependent hydrolase